MKKLERDSLLERYRSIIIIVLIIFLAISFNVVTSRLRPFVRVIIPQIPIYITENQVEKPNIVLILLDDLDDSVSPFWEAMPATRKLLKDRGMTFANSFSPNPLCCPARASLLTGKYSHNTKVYNNDGKDGGWQQFYKNGNEDVTFAVYLQKAGYTTSHIGKYLNGLEDNPTHIPPGWSEWHSGVGRAIYTGNNYDLNENGKLVHYGDGEKDYLTDVIANKALSFIDKSEESDDKPFLLSLAPTAPHYPLPPAVRHRNHPFAKETLPKSPNFNEEDLSDKSSWLVDSAFTRSLFVHTSTPDYRFRMGSLYAVDEMIASIVSRLYEKGELENTYFIFTSDNGYSNGSHRLIQKMAPYEESQRVPLVISGPGIKRDSIENFALTIDIAPTILSLAGMDSASDIDGMSLVPLLFGDSDIEWRTDYIAEHKIGGLASEFSGYPWLLDFVTKFIDVPSYTALRTKDYLYIEWELSGNKKEYELYDMKKDRYQLNNLLSSESFANQELVNELKNRLDFLKTCKGKTCKL